MWCWPGHRSLPQSHWSSHRRIFLPTGAGLIGIIVKMKIVMVIVMTSVMDSKWLNTKLGSHGNCECSKSNLGWEPRIRILFVELVVELSKVGHHGKFVRATIFLWSLGLRKKLVHFPNWYVVAYLDTWTKSSTSRRAGIPSSFSATPKARAQFLWNELCSRSWKNGCFGYEM